MRLSKLTDLHPDRDPPFRGIEGFRRSDANQQELTYR